MNLIETLNWRYATKKMNGQKVPDEKIERILEAARLAPSSSGLQPFEIIVITNQELKEKLLPVSFNQVVVTGCSHLLVFAAWDHYTEERINKAFDFTNDQRGFKNEGFENYRKMLLSMYPPRTPEVNFEHAARQAYISFGIALTAAAFEQVDATPMEGFDAKAYDEMLNLKAKGLRSVVILPLGYRDTSGDWLANLKKVRKHMNDFVTYIR